MKVLYKTVNERGRACWQVKNGDSLFYRIEKTKNYYTLSIWHNYAKKFIPARYFARLRDAKKAVMY